MPNFQQAPRHGRPMPPRRPAMQLPVSRPSTQMPPQGSVARQPGGMIPPRPMTGGSMAPSTGGAIPQSFEDGGSFDNSDVGQPQDDGNIVDGILQYGRQKHGLTDGWRRSDNIDDDRNSSSGFGAMFTKDAAGGDRTDINGNTTAVDPVGRMNDALGSAAKWGINRLATGGDDDSGDSATAAIPGTLQADAGYNDIRSDYEDGGAVGDDDSQKQPSTAMDKFKAVGNAIKTLPSPVTPKMENAVRKGLNYIGVKGYDDGGSVDDDDTDDSTTGAIPDGSDGDADTAPSQAAQGLATAPDPKMAVSYLMGADAAPPQLVQAIERSVDPQGQMDPDIRRKLALQQAKKQGGDDAAWGVLQHYRRQYDTRKAFAAAALSGANGKPADINAAAQAATQAYTYLPDDTTVAFQPSANGITATVKRAGQPQPFATAQLNPQQFNEFLRGQSGQFDNVMENSGAQVLMKLQNSQGRPFDQQQQQGQGQPQQQPPLQGGSQSAPLGRGTRNPPPAQSVYDFRGTDGDPQAEERRLYGYDAPNRKANYDQQIEARAVQLFPNDRQKQLAWQNEQEQQKAENDINTQKAGSRERAATITQEGNAARARIYTNAKGEQVRDTNDTRKGIAANQQSRQTSDNQRTTDQRIVTSFIQSGKKLKPDTPDGQIVANAIKRLRANQYGQQGSVNPQGGTNQAPQQGAGQQSGPPQGHPNARQPTNAQGPGKPWYEKGADGRWHPIQ